MKPILFNTEMVQAILDGSKTQTRRICKHQFWSFSELVDHKNEHYVEEAPRYRIGDTLYVRETWQETTWMHPSNEDYGYIYKASENGKDWEENMEEWKWRPSIHMPKSAARIFLEVTDVNLERLHDIKEEDAVSEGIKLIDNNPPLYFKYGMTKEDHIADPFSHLAESAVESFKSLWQSIYGDQDGKSWNCNPWVWVYEFKIINK